MATTIERISPAQLETVVRQMSWRPRSKHAERAVAQQTGTAEYLVAWIDGKAVGHVLLKWLESPALSVQGLLEECAEVEDLYVAQDRWRQGIGTALLARCEDAAREHDVGKIGLAVGVENHPALGLYRARGYSETAGGPFETVSPTVDGATELCVYLTKELTATA